MDFIGNVHNKLTNVKLRLQKTYNWSEDFANLAINEYAKFLYLCSLFPNDHIIPGKVIDVIWHEHILHTKDYMEFCDEVFKQYLHHEPKDYSKPSDENDKVLFEKTLDKYKTQYGHTAPKSCWIDDVKKTGTIISANSSSSSNRETIPFDCRCAP